MSKQELKFTNFTKLNQEQLLFILSKRNSDEIRFNMTNTDIISEESHLKFCANLKNDDTKIYLAVFLDSKIIGVIDFQNIDREAHTYEPGSYFFDAPSILRSHAVIASNYVCLINRLYYPNITVKKTNCQALIFNTMKMGCELVSEDDEYYYLTSKIVDGNDPKAIEKLKNDIESLKDKYDIVFDL